MCRTVAAVMIAALAAGWSAPRPAPADDDLSAEGYAVLQTHCVRCHGEEFSFPGLDMRLRETLLTSDVPEKPAFLVPGKARESRIYLHAAGLRQDKMPPEGEPQPSPAEITLLEKWIDAGAEFPSFSDRPARAFVGEKQLVETLLADIEAQPEEKRPFLRYFTIGHLWIDPGTSDRAERRVM